MSAPLYSTLTYKGEEYMLIGDGSSNGSFARKAAKLKLYTTAPADKTGAGVVELADGNGYTTGGIAITVADWSYTSEPSRIVLADKLWTASGLGGMAGVAGAYITDAADNVLMWQPRAGGPVTIPAADVCRIRNLSVRCR